MKIELNGLQVGIGAQDVHWLDEYFGAFANTPNAEEIMYGK
jgi:hypothetical protein